MLFFLVRPEPAYPMTAEARQTLSRLPYPETFGAGRNY